MKNRLPSLNVSMDISNLYSQLTSEAKHYQEVQRTQWANKTVSCWPLLREIRIDSNGDHECNSAEA